MVTQKFQELFTNPLILHLETMKNILAWVGIEPESSGIAVFDLTTEPQRLDENYLKNCKFNWKSDLTYSFWLEWLIEDLFFCHMLTNVAWNETWETYPHEMTRQTYALVWRMYFWICTISLRDRITFSTPLVHLGCCLNIVKILNLYLSTKVYILLTLLKHLYTGLFK